MTSNGETDRFPAPVGEFHPARAQRSGIENIFRGPHGIRAGWRLLIFIFLWLACIKAEGFTLKHIPGVEAWFKAQDPNVFTPPVAIFSEGIMLFALVVATALMTVIEKRTYADYYLPLNQFLAKRFWQGVPYGFAMLSLLLVLIAAFHGFSLGNLALSGADALKFGGLYGIAFLMVGLFEEFSFRVHASDAGAGDRVLAGGDCAFDFVWRDPSEQWRRSVVRRSHGWVVWTAGGIRFAADREYMVPDWNARGLGLVRDVFLWSTG